MAIAPITGMLKKRFLFDLGFGISLGISAAYGFWYMHHLKIHDWQAKYYLKLEQEKNAAAQ
ncbi:hypothetical protein FISHEDRAFT_70347 [Fistulina hepatica ATCC 64428]|uniref:Cytochrome c oxidase polypeptide VIIA n=1 Tax=Fistulina hepatica ATCC 64428 TaxID=1128425 RepID=A0A0D7AM46_9AGAR|nr:hypothetical protein FISHEDRAFT_70347 [Fistulina hepatica ATCC 64428]